MNILDDHEIITYTRGSSDKYTESPYMFADKTVVNYVNKVIHNPISDQPSIVSYIGDNTLPYMYEYYHYGKEHRSGGKPTTVILDNSRVNLVKINKIVDDYVVLTCKYFGNFVRCKKCRGCIENIDFLCPCIYKHSTIEPCYNVGPQYRYELSDLGRNLSIEEIKEKYKKIYNQ